MIESVSGGIPPQIPAAKAFRPGEPAPEGNSRITPNNAKNTNFEPTLNGGISNVENTKQIRQAFELTNPDPNRLGSSDNRGNVFDINV